MKEEGQKAGNDKSWWKKKMNEYIFILFSVCRSFFIYLQPIKNKVC